MNHSELALELMELQGRVSALEEKFTKQSEAESKAGWPEAAQRYSVAAYRLTVAARALDEARMQASPDWEAERRAEQERLLWAEILRLHPSLVNWSEAQQIAANAQGWSLTVKSNEEGSKVCITNYAGVGGKVRFTTDDQAARFVATSQDLLCKEAMKILGQEAVAKIAGGSKRSVLFISNR